MCFSQCAVRAATQGRVLVLEGLEKAERNVLPVLNNLLENREMQLEDGRFLMSAERYDKLLQVRTEICQNRLVDLKSLQALSIKVFWFKSQTGISDFFFSFLRQQQLMLIIFTPLYLGLIQLSMVYI